tara:strand:+ start:24049 stop:25986 length:1938 start_codon:yes stop_codon:yes gene_type:complete
MSLPPQPFDGQIFVDSFRRKWTFDGSTHCWRKSGTVPDIPAASEFQPGLLTAEFKRLIDGIPNKGGHFGIIAKPLLSLVPNNPNVVHKDKVRRSITIEAGTSIRPTSVEDRSLTPNTFNGKALIFTSGVLKKKAFLIFSNTDETISVEGDATEAAREDSFQIADLSELNPSGVLLGDIMLISDSLDITCVDGDGVTINNNNEACNLDIIRCDNVDNPPGLNLTINQDFLENLCVVVPGCKGPRGKRGEKGEKGPDGTGDGPAGEQGDPGFSGPAVGSDLTNIEIIDIDDIFDTAIVAAELDAAAGQLNIIRAKVRTPDNDTPATQVISTPIDRSIVFQDDTSFDFEILMPPNGDPIGTADIDILKYPRQFTREQAEQATNVNKVKLSDFITRASEAFEDQLSELNDKYNQQIKTYIESKDESARTILANLAQEVAACEWELPIEFCLGISPGDCHPSSGAGGAGGAASGYDNQSFIFPYSSVLFGTTGPSTAIDLGVYTVLGVTNLASGVTDVHSVMFPSQQSSLATATLPPGGYVIQYESGAIKSSMTDWIVGDTDLSTGFKARVKDGGAAVVQFSMPVPSAVYNASERSSVELVHKEAPISEKVIVIEITDAAGGQIALEAPLPGIQGQGEIKVRVFQVDITV